MSKRKTLSMCYFLGRAFFLGFGFSVLLNISNKDSWICFLCGSILGLLFVYALSKIKENMKGKGIYSKTAKAVLLLVEADRTLTHVYQNSTAPLFMYLP